MEDIIHIVSAYAPQIGLTDVEKSQFREGLENLTQSIPNSENVIFNSDFNGHIGSHNHELESVHGGYDFGHKNEAGRSILEFIWFMTCVFQIHSS